MKIKKTTQTKEIITINLDERDMESMYDCMGLERPRYQQTKGETEKDIRIYNFPELND